MTRLSAILLLLLYLALCWVAVSIWGETALWLGLVLALLSTIVWQALRYRKLAAWVAQPESFIPALSPAVQTSLRALRARLKTNEQQQSLDATQIKHLSEAIDTLPDALLVLDDMHWIKWCNRAAEQQLSIDRVRDVDKPLSYFLREPVLMQAINNRFATPLIHTALNETSQWAYSGLRLAESNTWILLIRDVTQTQRVEAMRRDFLANISHELKTPLTAVTGFIDAVLQFNLEGADKQDALRLARTQADTLQRLVQDLLSLSRLETQPLPRQLSAVRVNDWVSEAVAAVQALASPAHSFKLSITSAQDQLKGEPDELHSALVNLLSNAIYYSPKGGQIEVSWAVTAVTATLSVRDQGMGIDASHLPRLTERFYRVQTGRSRLSNTGGTGLGLAIVKHVATRHHAQLHIESTLGEGSVFSLVFPRDQLG
jgi:two-component system, OmpR family, phosphate regulon sensor histidine kinase PhoR